MIMSLQKAILPPSSAFCNSSIVLDSSRTCTKVSMMASVVVTACSLLSMVASIYKPRSVNAVGATLLNFSFLRWLKILTTLKNL